MVPVAGTQEENQNFDELSSYPSSSSVLKSESPTVLNLRVLFLQVGIYWDCWGLSVGVILKNVHGREEDY